MLALLCDMPFSRLSAPYDARRYPRRYARRYFAVVISAFIAATPLPFRYAFAMLLLPFTMPPPAVMTPRYATFAAAAALIVMP